MIIKVNDNIKIWKEFNPFELYMNENLFNSSCANRNLAKLGFNKERVEIKNRWFDVLTPSELVRKRNKSDGYYRVVYIQINMESGEYYIGKANRPKWSELKRYQGSGLKFVNKFNKNSDEFVRFYIASCETAEETELLESILVDSELLSDEKCLNLVAGGGGTTKHPLIAETSEKKREYMKSHPEQFQSMLEASKKAFQSGDSLSLRARNLRIKEVMSDEKYREMTRERIKNWIVENPEEYAAARKKNHEAIKTPECQEKRKASFDNWVKNNPEEYQAWQEKLISSRTTPEATEKRKASLKEWSEKNPEQANVNVKKRAKAAAEKLSKEVCMIDLQSGGVLKTFPSQHAAAKWLVENGKAKNLNCVSSISSVCLRKPCTTGYGSRKKAYGYGWCFASEIKN
ncbi:TPA: hypothetical protein ACF5XO_001311 [Legionella pneumophila]|nr:hypothetical protein [Legionella pneumophila]HAU1874390.1 hypothetical protein [Legionella pneumophila]HBD7079389.1 hypothetical protein [Legionella pneumophila]HCC0692343.1 hypothetical protein [Legionella pneumophila]